MNWITKTTLAVIAVLATNTPATADILTARQAVQGEILPGWRDASGRNMTAVKLTLAEGWKTYWRVPGEAGIPPRFDWSGSTNVKSVKLHWPKPDIFYQYGLRSIGYSGQLVLPVEVRTNRSDAATQLDAKIEIGVCKDVCLPVRLNLRAELPGAGPPASAEIRRALAARPATAKEAGVSAVRCDISPIKDGLRITANITLPPTGAEEIAVLELPDQTIWMSEVSTKRTGKRLTAVYDMLPTDNAPFLLSRSAIRITVLGSDKMVDILGCSAG